MYIKLQNNEIKPYSLFQLRKDNPNTSFPKSIPLEIVESYDVYECKQGPRPQYDFLTETIQSSGILFENGEYIQKWQVSQLDQSTAEANIRNKRDSLIEEDIDKINGIWWEQMDDTKKQEWRDYRQNLLDIPQQTGFPYNVNWPNKPL